jgi:hypothetical protein
MKRNFFFNFLTAAAIPLCILFFDLFSVFGQEAQLKVSTPNGNEKYVIGSMVEIQWIAKNYLGTIDILLKKNDFVIGEIANNINVSGGKFSWKAGMVKIGLAGPSDTYKILIRTSDGKYQDESNASFTILATTLAAQNAAPVNDPTRLAITKPDAGSRWCLDSQSVIQWTGNLPASAMLKIELLPGSGSGAKVIANSTANTGSYPWKINLAQYNFNEGVFKVKISTTDGGLVTESVHFRIGRDLVLLTPKFNQVWRKGGSYRIEWLNDCNIPSNAVKIELLDTDKNTVLPLAAGVALNKNYSWTIPNNLKPGEYHIRVTTTDKLFFAENPITIEEPVKAAPAPKPSITITQPNVGSQWCSGQKYQIQWGSTLPADAKLKIELLSTKNAAKELLAGSVPNTGSYDFNIDPQQYPFNRQSFRLKLSTLDDTVFFETADFLIGKPLLIDTPKNTDIWHKGRSYNISWTLGCNSTAQTVRLDLLDQYNNVILYIASDLPINQAYNWGIPVALDVIPGVYKIKVSTTDNQMMAEQPFKLAGAR